MLRSHLFKLYDIEESQTKNSSLVEIKHNYDQFNVDLNKFTNKSLLVKKYSTSEKQIVALKDYLLDILGKVNSLLNIMTKNYSTFLKIISGKSELISVTNLFDIFKLAKFFGIDDILKFLKEFCSQANQVKDILNILKKDDIKYNISKEEEKYFNEFIDFGKFSDILAENIQDCFKSYSFKDNFPHSTLFKLLQKCKNKDQIPSSDLYYMISKSLDKDLHFLPYIDISKLYTTEQKNLFQSIFDIEKKLQPPEEEIKETNETPNDTIEQAKIFQSQKQVDLKRSNSSSSNEVGKNITRPDFSSVPSTQSYSSNRKQSSTSNADDMQNISKTQKPPAKIIGSDKKDDKTANNQSNPTNPEESQSDSTESDIPSSDQSKQPDSGKSPSSKTTTDYTQTKSDSHVQRTTSNKEYHPPTSHKNYKRIGVFKENEKIVKNGYYYCDFLKKDIGKDLDYSLKHTALVSDHEKLIDQTVLKKINDASLRKDKSSLYRKVEIKTESTFAAAIKCKDDSRRVCVLNFASATQPGGGVLNGRNAQEEVLSRQSTLYFSLVQMKDFYDHNKRTKDPFGTDYMIYSPNVIIIRNDDDKLISLPVKVSVISSVAVNYAEILEIYKGQDMKSRVYDTMKKRCRRILELCIKEGNDIIVLGAFGCGVFQNSPEMISKIFYKIIIEEGYGEMFTKIVFAIKIKPDQSTELIDAFKNAFKPHHAGTQTTKQGSWKSYSGNGTRPPSGTSGTGAKLTESTSKPGLGPKSSSGTKQETATQLPSSSSSTYKPKNHS